LIGPGVPPELIVKLVVVKLRVLIFEEFIKYVLIIPDPVLILLF
jgi:hypothetical protein